MRRGRRGAASGIVWGVALIAMGTLFLLAEQGLVPRDWMWNWWNWWPAVLIVVGLVRLVRPNGPRDVGRGVTTILLGLWFFANLYEWYGLRWHNSWPLALVAVGAGTMTGAIATALWRGREEKEESHG